MEITTEAMFVPVNEKKCVHGAAAAALAFAQLNLASAAAPAAADVTCCRVSTSCRQGVERHSAPIKGCPSRSKVVSTVAPQVG